jgi:hypothetical protein
LILTAIASPDGGPLADIALFVPIIILLEGSIWYAKRYEEGREDEEPESRATGTACAFCGGEMDASGVFCSRCGKSRV